MSISEKREVYLNSPPRTRENRSRISVIGKQAGLLAIAIFGTLLSAKIWVPIAFFLVDTFPENPALAAAILLVVCAVFFLCILGAKKPSHMICLGSRAILLFLSVVAAIASMEAISIGWVTATVNPSREGLLWMSIAIVLVAFAALGFKAVLGWRLSYWIVFLAVFSTLIFATFGIGVFSLL